MGNLVYPFRMRAFFSFGVKRKFSHKVAVIILLTFKFSSHRLSHLNCRTTLWDDQVGYSSYDRLVFLAVHFLLIGSVTAHQMHFQPWKISPTFVGNIVCFPSSFFFFPHILQPTLWPSPGTQYSELAWELHILTYLGKESVKLLWQKEKLRPAKLNDSPRACL